MPDKKTLQKIAHSEVKKALNIGILEKASNCSRCKQLEQFGADGRSLLHAHHDDYEKPLMIRWMCSKCHRIETPMPRGEDNGFSVLTKGLVIAARLLKKEGFTIAEIARFYNVSMPGLSHAINGYTWNWIAERGKE